MAESLVWTTTLVDGGDRLRIVFPTPRSRRLVSVHLLWLISWTIGIIATIAHFSSPDQTGQEPTWVTLVWLAGWAVSIATIDSLLYLLFGREVMSISDGVLTIAREAPFYTRTQHFDLKRIVNLRAVRCPMAACPWGNLPAILGWLDALAHFCGIGGGHLAFDYGHGTCRFGAGLRRDEARHLVTRIMVRFPSVSMPILIAGGSPS